MSSQLTNVTKKVNLMAKKVNVVPKVKLTPIQKYSTVNNLTRKQLFELPLTPETIQILDIQESNMNLYTALIKCLKFIVKTEYKGITNIKTMKTLCDRLTTNSPDLELPL